MGQIVSLNRTLAEAGRDEARDPGRHHPADGIGEPVMPRRCDPKDVLEAYVTDEGIEALREHNFPCSEVVWATATPSEYGIRMTGSRRDFESLAGWTASEANYARKKRRTRQARIFDEICDSLESALGSGFVVGSSW